MAEYVPDTRPGRPGGGFARVAIGLAALAVVAVMVLSYVSAYRTSVEEQSSSDGSHETTGSVEATEAAGAAEGSADEQSTEDAAEDTPESPTRYVVVVIPGLNYRMEPKSDGQVIRTLPEGTRLVLLGEQDGWYQVRDDDNVTGWVSSSTDYVRVEDEQ